MYIDVSSYNGKIDWKSVAGNSEKINGVILRTTTKNDKLDTRTIENYNGILRNMSYVDELSMYKFSYANTYIDARVECRKCINEIQSHGLHADYLYLDLENHGVDYTTDSANAVILGYMDEMAKFGVSDKFRLYFNYNYLKNIIDPIWRQIPLWLARYNKELGDTFDANVVLWQYASNGKVDGINGNVDVSKEITK